MFQIDAPFGIVGLWDVAFSPPTTFVEVQSLVADLRERTRNGDIFFIDAEDPVSYRIEIIVNGDLPSTIAEEFEPHGGVFRLRIPSGRLRVGSVPASTDGGQIDTTPGDYFVRPYVRRQFDSVRYDQMMVQLVGEADWHLKRRIENFGAFGCLFLVVGAVFLAIPFTRRIWWAILLLFASPWLMYLIGTRLPRYKRVKTLTTNYEQLLPHFIIALKSSAAASDIPGGWVSDL